MDLVFPSSLSFSLNKCNYLTSFIILSIDHPTSLELVETSKMQHINFFAIENDDLEENVLPYLSF